MRSPFRSLACNTLCGYRTSRQSSRWTLCYRLARGSDVSQAAGYLQRRGVTTHTTDLSYAEGPSEPPFLAQTVPEHFATVVSQYGDLPAAVFRSPTTMDSPPSSSPVDIPPVTTTLTYEALDVQSNSLAHALRSLGVRKGDRVAVSLGNVAEHIVLMYALFKLGAILVPLNPTFNSHQLSSALSRLGVEVLIIGAVTDLAYKPCRGRSNLDLLSALIPDLGDRKVESPSIPTLRNVVVVDNTPSHPQAVFPPLGNLRALTPYTTLLPSSFSPSSSRSVVPDSPLAPDETINIQFTSGTTSLPKAAMLSHRTILNNGRLVASRMGLVAGPRGADRIVCPPPLFHCFGSVLGFMATATTGACIIFPSPAFCPAAALRAAAEEHATGLHGVPTMFAAELELLAHPSFAARLPHGGKNLANHLKKGIAAGSPVPEPLMLKLNEKMGLHDLVICYGMTETGPVSCMTSPNDNAKRRASTVGKVMPHTRVKIVARGDRGSIVPRGERGELATTGYLVMRGYYGQSAIEDLIFEEDPEGEEIEEGTGRRGRRWMYTGDEAVMDDEGYVTITGRIKDLIIRGGENIHPLEVEVAIMKHLLVREASVVGVSDERYGEVVGAFVAVHDDVGKVDDDGGAESVSPRTAGKGTREREQLSKNEVRRWVGQHLSSHLVPKYVFWLDEFPKTASGKIQKYRLRDLAKELVDKGVTK
ncbi:hypothetical protein AAE478_008815 [Parahypoxylon ruwenzoriense]